MGFLLDECFNFCEDQLTVEPETPPPSGIKGLSEFVKIKKNVRII